MEHLIKYYIVPKNSPIETVKANSSDEALIAFASSFPVDLNRYFKAVTKEEFEAIEIKRDSEGDRNVFIRFAKEVLTDDFDVPEDDLDDLAATAFDFYCDGDGSTEYEAIQNAAEEYFEEQKPG